MARTDYDEVWEKQEDGSMKLLSRTERIVSDEELEPERLQELAAKPVARLTNPEKDELLGLLVKQVVGEQQ